MKEQLTLEHLAIYLPYELKFKAIGSCNNYEVLCGLESYTVANWSMPVYNDNEPVCTSKIDYSSMWSLKEIKPVLRPLSDLTKEIEVNGENFIPAKEIFGDIEIAKPNGEYVSIGRLAEYERPPATWKAYEFFKAVKMHFDIFGLIDKGLAIDINTL